jgi:hypothetical protein
MSRKMNDFAVFAIFVRFYLFAALDLIFVSAWTPKEDIEQLHRNDRTEFIRRESSLASVPSRGFAA